MIYETYMEIGPIIYRIKANEPIKVAEEYSGFFYSEWKDVPKEKSVQVVDCVLRRIENFRNLKGELVYQNPERLIFTYQGLEQRVHMIDGNVYGIYRQTSAHEIEIELRQDLVRELKLTIVLLEMLASEQFLLEENALVLHSSYIEWKNQGILFTAPSGTGKSTQAELWRKYAGATIINGDRSIIYWNQEKQEFWTAGLPFCGSSQICVNRKMPLRAIVFLDQEKENDAKIFPKTQAVGRLFGEMSINQWNRAAVERSLELIENLTDHVKMIHLDCNMDLDAVECLRYTLKKYE